MGTYDPIFTPLKIGSVEIKNRIIMCAMGGTSLIEHGKFEQKSADMFIERAKGGVGLIIPGISTITDMWGRGGWLYEARDNVMEPLTETMKSIHSYGAKLFLQIGAGMGRALAINSPMLPPGTDLCKALNGPTEGLQNVWLPNKKHRALSLDEIHEIIEAFGKSAKMVKDAGVDGVEVHAVHEGYLLDQFAIAATNHRTDEYGGSLENRLRFAVEIIRKIKETCGEDFPVSVRYSVASKMKGFNSGAIPGEPYQEFGRSLEESPAVARILEAAGCDLLNADNGSYDSWYWPHPPVYMPHACNLPDAVFIKQFVHIPVACAGRMEDLSISAPAVAKGSIDAIGIARQLLADPEWPNKVQNDEIEDIRPCIACHTGCFGLLFGRGTTCALNPVAMNERTLRILPAEKKKKIAVVGGGIGGMEVARLSAIRGHSVTLFEKTGELGGVFIAAASPSFKESDKKLIQWYIRQIEKLGIDIRLNTEATPELLKSLAADEIVIATGAKERTLPVPGIDGQNVLSAIDFLLHPENAGTSAVVVGGGLTGCEIAYELSKSGKKVSIVEMLDDILKVKDLAAPNATLLRDYLKYYQVDIHTSSKLCEVTPSGVRFEHAGDESVIAADSVILAVGYISGAPLAEQLKDCANVHVIGDAEHVANLMAVVSAAYNLALAF